MSPITATRRINAPVDIVFHTVADISRFSEAVPHIVNVEFLTEQQSGVGTRFRETRVMHGKEIATELEVTEYVENDRVRIVADSHGTVWDTVFSVSEEGAATVLAMTMTANARTLAAKLTTRMISGMVAKAVEADMDFVKEYCENRQT
ncbi:MAG: SRPBCC family protein [Planctomycetota bacterium]|nr:MAG: SRPBCC family protein [Planctomycetota bacterium]REJ96287.1 MAG: SRPBCC family protein [Planctomycetota bacterium]REK22247.1 MAG: SRPBCC family protein [Planctomycetota bacterium]REK27430.1 MAG: SRPBCC family protein [Planctomycetota bacterium]